MELWEKRCEAGLVSPGEFYLAWNPDAGTPEEGEKRLVANLEAWKRIKDATATMTDIMGAAK